ncbi:MAG: regulator [Gammaproteobacteria bacterium RIFCSPHIGHO2_12_FULL_45_12]|nr:MAG: regulator [Gammaproteobacteria bacterium RIFCSPHIGHO2_12_FULL_45_12]
MRKVLHKQSTLTDRYQTTIPEPIRVALHLGKRDKIEFTVENSGKVTLSRVNEDDPILSEFLSFLANDIKAHPEKINPINHNLVNRAKSLVSGMEIDLDAPLPDEED